MNHLLEESGFSKERKFSWIDKWVKMTCERAKIDAKANNTYIIYNTESGWVKKYPNGSIVPFENKR